MPVFFDNGALSNSIYHSLFFPNFFASLKVLTLPILVKELTQFLSAYYCENWKFYGVPCKTNTATNAFTRSPGISIIVVFKLIFI